MGLDFLTLARFLRRWYRLFFLLVVLGAGLGWLYSLLAPPVYEAEADIVLLKSQTQVSFEPKIQTRTEFDLVGSASDQTSRRKSLIVLGKSPDLVSAVSAKLSKDVGATERSSSNLAAAVTVVGDSDLIRLKVYWNDPQKAALIANMWAEEYTRLVNSIYNQGTLSLGDFRDQTDAAKKDYDTKEAAVVAYLANNPISDLNRQIAEKQVILSIFQSGTSALAQAGSNADKSATARSYLDAIITQRLAVFTEQKQAVVRKLSDLYGLQNNLDRVLSDARSLRERVARSTAGNTRGAELAALLLEASAFNNSDKLPVALSISLTTLSSTGTVTDTSDLVGRLDSLIATIEDRRKTVQADIDIQSKLILNYAGGSDLQSQLEGLPQLITFASNNQTSQSFIHDLQTQINQLQGQSEQENATRLELTRARDLAWGTYATLSNKLAEVSLSAQAGDTLVRSGIPAVPPERAILPRTSVNILVGAGLGLVLGLVTTLGTSLARSLKMADLAAEEKERNSHPLVKGWDGQRASGELVRKRVRDRVVEWIVPPRNS